MDQDQEDHDQEDDEIEEEVRDYYSLLNNFYQPKSYANPANYYISNTHACNVPDLKSLLDARCSLIGSKEDIIQESNNENDLILKQDNKEDLSDESSIEESFIEYDSNVGKYSYIIHIESSEEDSSPSSEGSSCFDDDDLCDVDSEDDLSDGDVNDHRPDGNDHNDVGDDNSSDNEDDDISSGDDDNSSDDEDDSSSDDDDNSSDEHDVDEGDEDSDDSSNDDDDDSVEDENCLWDWQLEPKGSKKANEEEGKKDEEKEEGEKEEEEKAEKEEEPTDEKTEEVEGGGDQGMVGGDDQGEAEDEEEMEDVLFQGSEFLPFLKCVGEWKRKEKRLILKDSYLKYLWEWKRYHYKTNKPECFRYRTERTSYGEPSLRECICEDELDWTKFKKEDEEEEKIDEKIDDDEATEDDEPVIEEDVNCCDILVANVEVRQMVQSYPIHTMKHFMSGAVWKKCSVNDEAIEEFLCKTNLTKSDINRYYIFNEEDTYHKDSIQEGFIMNKAKSNEAVVSYEDLEDEKIFVEDSSDKSVNEESISEIDSNDKDSSDEDSCDDGSSDQKDTNKKIIRDLSDEDLLDKQLIEKVISEVNSFDEDLEKDKHFIKKNVPLEEFDWWIPEQPLDPEEIKAMLKMLQMEEERIYNEQRDALIAKKKIDNFHFQNQVKTAVEDDDFDAMTIYTYEIPEDSICVPKVEISIPCGDPYCILLDDLSCMEKRGTLSHPQILKRPVSVKVSGLHDIEVTQKPMLTQLDYIIPDLSKNEVAEKIPFYPKYLNERLPPLDFEMVYYKSIGTDRLTKDEVLKETPKEKNELSPKEHSQEPRMVYYDLTCMDSFAKETPSRLHQYEMLHDYLIGTEREYPHILDPWPEMFERIYEQKILGDNSWYSILPPNAIHASVDQCTALNVLEIKSLHSLGLFNETIKHFLHFYQTLVFFDFYNEKELETFKNIGGSYLIKDLLQYEHIDVQIASLDLLRRFTKVAKYAEHMHDIFPGIAQYLRHAHIKLTGNEQELYRSILAVMVLKNMARCDTIKKEFEKERYLIEIYFSFNKCMNLLEQTLLPGPVRNIAFYYAGVICQILSDASDKKSCKVNISRQDITRQVKIFLENPLFQNDVIFFYKNMSTLERDRLVMLEQNILHYIKNLLQHYIKNKHFYPCVELVRNLLRSQKFVEFVKSEEIIQIVRILVVQIDKLGLYKYSEELTNILLEIIQSSIHKYSDDTISIECFKDLHVVEGVLENLKFEIQKVHDECLCIVERQNEAKNRIELRIDILSHLVDHVSMRYQFISLEPFLELVKLQLKELNMYPKTFRKVLRLIKKLGTETRLKKDYYKELRKFWTIYKNQCHEKTRFEASIIISEICSGWTTPCLNTFSFHDLQAFFGKYYKPNYENLSASAEKLHYEEFLRHVGDAKNKNLNQKKSNEEIPTSKDLPPLSYSSNSSDEDLSLLSKYKADENGSEKLRTNKRLNDFDESDLNKEDVNVLTKYVADKDESKEDSSNEDSSDENTSKEDLNDEDSSNKNLTDEDSSSEDDSSDYEDSSDSDDSNCEDSSEEATKGTQSKKVKFLAKNGRSKELRSKPLDDFDTSAEGTSKSEDQMYSRVADISKNYEYILDDMLDEDVNKNDASDETIDLQKCSDVAHKRRRHHNDIFDKNDVTDEDKSDLITFESVEDDEGTSVGNNNNYDNNQNNNSYNNDNNSYNNDNNSYNNDNNSYNTDNKYDSNNNNNNAKKSTIHNFNWPYPRRKEDYGDLSISCPCLNCVVTQLRPLVKSKNEYILEGMCTIINAILNVETIEKHFDVQHKQQAHKTQDKQLNICGVCQILIWMINTLKRVNKRKKVKVGLLQQLMIFFHTISTQSEMVEFLAKNDLLSMLIPFITHKDSIVHTKVLHILNQCSNHEEFISRKKKLQLFRELYRLRNANNSNEHLCRIMKDFFSKMVQVQAFISYDRDGPASAARVGSDVTKRIFKINRWVR